MPSFKRNREEVVTDENLHRSIFEQNPLPMLIHDPDSQMFIGVNDAAIRKYGYSREEFLKMSIDDLGTDEKESDIDREDGQSSNGEKIGHHRLKSGELIDVELTSHGLEFSGHKAVFTVVHQINSRTKAAPKTRRDILEEIPVGYYRTVPQRSFVEVNHAFAQMLGYTTEEMLSLDVPDELCFNRDETMVGKVGQDFPFKPKIFRLRTREGNEVYIEDFSRYVRDNEGKVVFREGICRRVTDVEAAEEKSIELEEGHRALVDQMPVAVAVHTDWKLAYLNRAAEKLTGTAEPGGAVGRSFLEFVHPESLAAALEHVEAIMNNIENIDTAELKMLRQDGSTASVEVTSMHATYHGKPSIQSAFRDVTEQRQLEDRMHLQSAALNAVTNAVVITDRSGKVEWINPAFEKLTGYNALQAVGADIGDLVGSGKQDESFYKEMWNTILTGKPWRGQLVNRRRDGGLYNEWMTVTPVAGDDGQIAHFIATKEDITERKSLEDELTQAQKLDAIGRLAGGIAHDYNNILGVILGYGELIKGRLQEEESVRKQLDAIIAAARRGSDLTKQLLSFARREAVSPKVLDVNSSIASIMEMLHQLIGENISLVFNPGRNLWNVEADPSQLDQILVNLVTNARDAIDDVGTITIETANVLPGEDRLVGLTDRMRGGSIRISVTDTGKGIERGMLKEIFEPFFTTKVKGHGTGLGLSMVYGIVKQNDGSIEVKSEPGMGTTFDVYFPSVAGEPEKSAESSADAIQKGNATVLIVEDQSDLLESAKKSLEEYGYRVFAALDPHDAIAMCKEFSGSIDLLLADVIMPAMNGSELSRRIGKIKPGIKTLFMSGYAADMLEPPRGVGKGVDFIQKPFTPHDLAGKVQKVLKKG